MPRPRALVRAVQGEAMTDECIADIVPVPAPFRGRVLTTSTKLMENGIFLLQFLLLAACTFAPAIVGGLAATSHLVPGNTLLSFSPVLIGLAATAGLGWVLGGYMLRQPWSSRYMLHKTRAEFLGRQDPLVDANCPDAIFVEVIPRRNWGQITLQNAEDIGLLRIDPEQRGLLIEGDNKRYRIPAQSVVSCDVESMNSYEAKDPQAFPIGLVVLTVRDRLGDREVPLRPVRTVAGQRLGGNYMARAQELQRRILSICSASVQERMHAHV
jgi:hypothetical protein